MTDIDELREFNERLTRLLDDPQPGLASWNQALTLTFDSLARKRGYMLEREPHRFDFHISTLYLNDPAKRRYNVCCMEQCPYCGEPLKVNQATCHHCKMPVAPKYPTPSELAAQTTKSLQKLMARSSEPQRPVRSIESHNEALTT